MMANLNMLIVAVGLSGILVSCSPKIAPPKQDMLLFNNEDGVYHVSPYNSKGRLKLSTTCVAKVKGCFIKNQYMQQGDTASYVVEYFKDPNSYTVEFYSLNLATLATKVTEKWVYTAQPPGNCIAEKYVINSENQLTLSEKIATNEPLYKHKFRLRSEYPVDGIEHQADSSNAPIQIHKGSLYTANNELLVEHTGQYNMKFGGGCSSYAVDPTGSYVVYSYRFKSLTWSGKNELNKVAIASKEITPLLGKGFYYDPQFCDDGSYLLFNTRKAAYILNMDTLDKVRLGKASFAKWINK